MLRRLLADIRAAEDLPELRALALSSLQVELRADGAALICLHGGQPDWATSWNLDPRLLTPFIDEADRYARDLDKGFAALARNGGAFIDTEVYSARERQTLPYFRDVIRPHGIRSQIFAVTTFRGALQSS